MKLNTYLDQADRGAAASIARALDVSPVMVTQWAKGKKTIPPSRAAAIEAATDGAVLRWDCRPADWHLIWPELVGRDGAPELPATETKQAA